MSQLLLKAIESGVVGKPLVARVQAMRRRKVPGWGVLLIKRCKVAVA